MVMLCGVQYFSQNPVSSNFPLHLVLKHDLSSGTIDL